MFTLNACFRSKFCAHNCVCVCVCLSMDVFECITVWVENIFPFYKIISKISQIFNMFCQSLNDQIFWGFVAKEGSAFPYPGFNLLLCFPQRFSVESKSFVTFK